MPPCPRRGELTDEAWAVIAPLLPEPGGALKWWRDHHQVINGFLWKRRTGAPWRDLTTRYAKRASLYRTSPVLIGAIIWLA
ncbi:transposase [Micromonospora parva]|uniref:transposase n=1 Tax=Micromonospora parva TaxID=1464048 RepID=UPI0033EF8E64